MDHPDFVDDGEFEYSRDEYINVVYPQMKENARSKQRLVTNNILTSTYLLEDYVERWGEYLITDTMPMEEEW